MAVELDVSHPGFLGPGEGERHARETRALTIKVGREELALVEFELEPGFEGPRPHIHKLHVDSFYVLEGEPRFQVGDEILRGGPGAYVAAPPGAVHSFSNPGPGRARLLNVHAPSCGFHEYVRVMGRTEGELDEATNARYDVYELD